MSLLIWGVLELFPFHRITECLLLHVLWVFAFLSAWGDFNFQRTILENPNCADLISRGESSCSKTTGRVQHFAHSNAIYANQKSIFRGFFSRSKKIPKVIRKQVSLETWMHLMLVKYYRSDLEQLCSDFHGCCYQSTKVVGFELALHQKH